MIDEREVIAEAIPCNIVYGRPQAADEIIHALSSHGFHILSDADLQARDDAVRDEVLDAAGNYLGAQYGNTALHHPTDRGRIIAAIRAMQGGKP